MILYFGRAFVIAIVVSDRFRVYKVSQNNKIEEGVWLGNWKTEADVGTLFVQD